MSASIILPRIDVSNLRLIEDSLVERRFGEKSNMIEAKIYGAIVEIHYMTRSTKKIQIKKTEGKNGITLFKTFGYDNVIPLDNVIQIINESICPMAKNIKVKLFTDAKTKKRGILYAVPNEVLNDPNNTKDNQLEIFYNKLLSEKKNKRSEEVIIRTKAMIKLIKKDFALTNPQKRKMVIKIFEEFSRYLPSFCTGCKIKFIPEKNEIIFSPVCFESDLRAIFIICGRNGDLVNSVMINAGYTSIKIIMNELKTGNKRKRPKDVSSRKKSKYY